MPQRLVSRPLMVLLSPEKPPDGTRYARTCEDCGKASDSNMRRSPRVGRIYRSTKSLTRHPGGMQRPDLWFGASTENLCDRNVIDGIWTRIPSHLVRPGRNIPAAGWPGRFRRRRARHTVESRCDGLCLTRACRKQDKTENERQRKPYRRSERPFQAMNGSRDPHLSRRTPDCSSMTCIYHMVIGRVNAKRHAKCPCCIVIVCRLHDGRTPSIVNPPYFCSRGLETGIQL